MENLSLNNNTHNHQDLQVVSELPSHQHISNDISEEPEKSRIKRRYTGAKDLRVVSQNQIIGEPFQGVRTRSSLRT